MCLLILDRTEKTALACLAKCYVVARGPLKQAASTASCLQARRGRDRMRMVSSLGPCRSSDSIRLSFFFMKTNVTRRQPDSQE